MTILKPLSVDQRWMLNFLNQHLDHWDDVRSEASKTLKKVHSFQDFVDWADCFLPRKRREELQRALRAFKLRQISKKAPPQKERKIVSVPLDEQVARLLQKKARAANCTMSELLLKKLA